MRKSLGFWSWVAGVTLLVSCQAPMLVKPAAGLKITVAPTPLSLGSSSPARLVMPSDQWAAVAIFPGATLSSFKSSGSSPNGTPSSGSSMPQTPFVQVLPIGSGSSGATFKFSDLPTGPAVVAAAVFSSAVTASTVLTTTASPDFSNFVVADLQPNGTVAVNLVPSGKQTQWLIPSSSVAIAGGGTTLTAATSATAPAVSISPQGFASFEYTLANPGDALLIPALAPATTGGQKFYLQNSAGARVAFDTSGNVVAGATDSRLYITIFNPTTTTFALANGLSLTETVPAGGTVPTIAQLLPPTGLSVTPSTSGTTGPTLTWQPVTGATGYNVYASTTTSTTPVKINATPLTGTSYTDTTQATGNGSTVYYQVSMVSSSGVESPPSGFVSYASWLMAYASSSVLPAVAIDNSGTLYMNAGGLADLGPIKTSPLSYPSVTTALGTGGPTGMTGIAVDNQTPTNVYAWNSSVTDQIATSGTTWSSLTSLPSVTAIASGTSTSSTPTSWAASSGGLYSGSGTAWSPVTITGVTLSTGALLAANSTTVCVTDSTGAVQVSTDSGTTWTQYASTNFSGAIQALGVDGLGGIWVGTSNALYVNTGGTTGTFSPVASLGTTGSVTSLAFSQNWLGPIVYAADNASPPAVHVSIDRGITWTTYPASYFSSATSLKVSSSPALSYVTVLAQVSTSTSIIDVVTP